MELFDKLVRELELDDYVTELEEKYCDASIEEMSIRLIGITSILEMSADIEFDMENEMDRNARLGQIFLMLEGMYLRHTLEFMLDNNLD